ncbi:MAG: hypothetical protein KF746_14150 [Chitinophagaceae bacterium]|nr:hypothetical protein [Chitinophagaceae bacterium]
MDTIDYNKFAETCLEELKVLQEKFQNKYDVDWYDNWFYNQSTGLLTFSTGSQELNFRYLDIGSLSESSKTWKWSWDNDTTLEKVKEKVWIIKQFGERSNFIKLTTGYFSSDECEAVRQNEGEWNDRSMAFAGIKVVCENCYFEMKELNLGHR